MLKTLTHSLTVILPQDVERLEKIGKGGFGIVHRGIWNHDGKLHTVAIKTTGDDIEKEACTWQSLDHSNIIKFYGVVGPIPYFAMVVELAKNGALDIYLKPENENVLFENILKWAINVASGTEYLHSNKIVHRDIKSANVVIDEGMTAKLCDFGTSRKLDHTTMVTFIGSYPWMSPEMIRQDPVTVKTDCWSFGVLLWELLMRETPFGDVPRVMLIYQVGHNKLKLNIPDVCPHTIAELMENCWNIIPKDRPDFSATTETLKRFEKDDEISFELRKFMKNKSHWMNNNIMTIPISQADIKIDTSSDSSIVWTKSSGIGTTLNEPPISSSDKSYSQTNAELMARIIFGEARGEGNEGQRAVGHVIVNRRDYLTAYPNTLEDVMLEKCDNNSRYCFQTLDSWTGHENAWQTLPDFQKKYFLQIAVSVISGDSIDPTNKGNGGATAFNTKKHDLIVLNTNEYFTCYYLCQINHHHFGRVEPNQPQEDSI